MPDSKQEQGLEEKEAKEKGKKVSIDKYNELVAENEKIKADRDYWKNEYYKVFADTQNLRKSLDEEKRDAIKYRAAGFLEELLPALDGFHMALSAPVSNPEIAGWRTGFTYIYNQIEKVLEDEGVAQIEPKEGDRFDATYMHAIDTVESEGEEGRVIKVLAKGYKLKDRLIRPVMVSVSKKPEPKAEENKEEAKEEANAA